VGKSCSGLLDVLVNGFGSGAGVTNATTCHDGLAQTASCFPITLVFITNMDLDGICAAHSLLLFPADVTDPTTLDGLMVGLLGDRPLLLSLFFFLQLSSL
jgi:hypothetical protein